MINKSHTLPIVYTILVKICQVSIIIVLLRVKQSIWQLCLKFKTSKFTLQRNQSSVFLQNEQQITDVYSEFCQISKMEFLAKKLTAISHFLFLENSPSQIPDRILNVPLDYLGCFTMVLRGIQGKIDICKLTKG